IGSNWEGQAVAGRSGTFEVWFKPDDLIGTHVVLEIGAGNKGVAICLEGNELVYSASATDGAGGNSYGVSHRETLSEARWHQAVIRVNYVDFTIDSYLDGVKVNSQPVPPSPSYRWTSANPAGVGKLAQDPAFPDATVAADVIAQSEFTDFEGEIAIFRYYGVDLFDSEVADNYAAMTDSDASTRRGDVDGNGMADSSDQLAVLGLAEAATTDAISPRVVFPFIDRNGGVHMHDPELNELYAGDFHWNSKGGFFNTEPTFRFPTVSVLEPVEVNDPALPTIRRAFVMDGVEGFRGPAPEPLDDNFNSGHVEFWVKADDLTGSHCLYEAGGDGRGFSINMVGDQLIAAINTVADDGLDEFETASAAGVMTTNWHKVEVIARRFTAVDAGIGQGLEIYLDGVQVARFGDEPGPDGIFETADDIDNANYGTGNSTFVGGNQSGFGSFWSSVRLPSGLTTAGLTPFNGLVGPIKITQGAPLPADIAARFAAETSGQNTINARSDVNGDGSANFLDTIEALKQIDAGR
ncbi:MAG: LamG-like jellyroll fold domain-containing protein, partial [Planctomycetota bacterium]